MLLQREGPVHVKAEELRSRVELHWQVVHVEGRDPLGVTGRCREEGDDTLVANEHLLAAAPGLDVLNCFLDSPLGGLLVVVAGPDREVVCED